VVGDTESDGGDDGDEDREDGDGDTLNPD